MASGTISKSIELSTIKFLLSAALMIGAASCGGGQFAATQPSRGSSLPGSAPVSSASLICLACPSVQPPIQQSDFFNSNMIGQQWTFVDPDGHHTFYSLTAAPASDYFPVGSITMNITKDFAGTYWWSGMPNASIDFVLSPNADGSYNSHGWVMYFGSTIPPSLPCHTTPCSEQVLAIDGTSNTYQITPPASLDATTTLITNINYERWDQAGQTFNSITGGTPTATSIYWKTVFSIRSDGLAISEQWEGDCGHERWYFKRNVGLVAVESPNDGHGTGANCSGQSTATITRIN